MSENPGTLEGLEGLLTDSVRVLRYPHETEPDEDGSTREWACDIVIADGSPAAGYSSYATIGLRDFETNLSAPDERPLRTELVTVGRTADRVFADALDACALAVASGSFHIRPGAVIPGAFGMVDGSRRCEHMLLVPPFLWPELQVVDERPVDYVLTRLQAVPITTSELRLANDGGYESLCEALDRTQADVTNPDRPSVV